MKEINKRKLDNIEMKWTTFPSDIVIVTCTNIKTRMVWVVWNNEVANEDFATTN